MAVYTKINADQIQGFLTELGQGRLLSWSGVADGLENTTYFLTCDSLAPNSAPGGGPRQWVLSILESADSQQIEFSVALMRRLHGAELPVPELWLHPGNGRVVHELAGKPALLSARIEGRHPGGFVADGQRRASPGQCRAVGDFLGRMHTLGGPALPNFPNSHGLAWLRSTLVTVGAELTEAERVLVDGLVARQADLRRRDPGLPVGAIHADLFRDNTLFTDNRLNAVIDFYSACTDWLLLDAAIVVNDWARNSDGGLNEALCGHFLEAYSRHRRFVASERRHWQDMLGFAALRFWLSRLLGRVQGRAPDIAPELSGRAEKDPEEFARIVKTDGTGVLPLPL